jgi:hypothetical protein
MLEAESCLTVERIKETIVINQGDPKLQIQRNKKTEDIAEGIRG